MRRWTSRDGARCATRTSYRKQWRRRFAIRPKGVNCGALTAALDTLPARQRAVIVLHDVEGFKHSEIGKILTIPEGTSRSDLHYARTHLRGVLGEVRRDL